MKASEPRQLKELRKLMPWTWDSKIDKHPPGASALRDFEVCDYRSWTSSKKTPRRVTSVPVRYGLEQQNPKPSSSLATPKASRRKPQAPNSVKVAKSLQTKHTHTPRNLSKTDYAQMLNLGKLHSPSQELHTPCKSTPILTQLSPLSESSLNNYDPTTPRKCVEKLHPSITSSSSTVNMQWSPIDKTASDNLPTPCDVNASCSSSKLISAIELHTPCQAIKPLVTSREIFKTPDWQVRATTPDADFPRMQALSSYSNTSQQCEQSCAYLIGSEAEFIDMESHDEVTEVMDTNAANMSEHIELHCLGTENVLSETELRHTEKNIEMPSVAHDDPPSLNKSSGVGSPPHECENSILSAKCTNILLKSLILPAKPAKKIRKADNHQIIADKLATNKENNPPELDSNTSLGRLLIAPANSSIIEEITVPFPTQASTINDNEIEYGEENLLGKRQRLEDNLEPEDINMVNRNDAADKRIDADATVTPHSEYIDQIIEGNVELNNLCAQECCHSLATDALSVSLEKEHLEDNDQIGGFINVYLRRPSGTKIDREVLLLEDKPHPHIQEASNALCSVLDSHTPRDEFADIGPNFKLTFNNIMHILHKNQMLISSEHDSFLNQAERLANVSNFKQDGIAPSTVQYVGKAIPKSMSGGSDYLKNTLAKMTSLRKFNKVL